MPPTQERDFPLGHPKAADYDPASPDAIEWARRNMHPGGERDFAVDHPKAFDTPGNTNHIPVRPGFDPAHPELEEHTGRTPEQARAAHDFYLSLLPAVAESPVLEPTIAANPPAVVHVQRAWPSAIGPGVCVFCPACKTEHLFDSRWTFNGNFELPSFTPSMLVNADDPKTRCHCIVTNGQITFTNDSGHALRGKTVELGGRPGLEAHE